MRQERTIHSGRSCCRADRREFCAESNQTATVKSHPLTGIGTRFLGNPLKFFVAIVERSCNRSATVPRRSIIIQRQPHPLMFRQCEWLKRTKYAFLVNGLEFTDHSIFIVRSFV